MDWVLGNNKLLLIYTILSTVFTFSTKTLFCFVCFKIE